MDIFTIRVYEYIKLHIPKYEHYILNILTAHYLFSLIIQQAYNGDMQLCTCTQREVYVIAITSNNVLYEDPYYYVVKTNR
jgi:hypothetical protein